MSTPTHEVDCLIIGAGVAGLWTRALLTSKGYSTLTIDRSAAGDGQTIASQGILHRGLKYQLSPAATRAAAELAGAYADWEAALAGTGPVNLKSVKTIATNMHMWATSGGVAGMLAKVTVGMASMTIASAAKKLEASERPQSFAAAPADAAIYEVAERCVDLASLLECLLAACDAPIELGAPTKLDQQKSFVDVQLAGGAIVRASVVIACAGEGNAGIARLAGLDAESCMQRRPLNMVAMRNAPFVLNGHCIQPMSDKPRLTVTTTGKGDERFWWLGGMLAEDGVGKSAEDQIRAARALLRECVPWADLSKSLFATFPIDRAEGKTAEGKRPDGPVIREKDRVLLAWPTKLALAPVLAKNLLELLTTRGIKGGLIRRGSVRVRPAKSPWLAEHVTWK